MGQDHEWVVAAARRFERPLSAYVRRLLGDAADSQRGQDIVQEAFLRLCKQSRHEIEPRLTLNVHLPLDLDLSQYRTPLD